MKWLLWEWAARLRDVLHWQGRRRLAVASVLSWVLLVSLLLSSWPPPLVSPPTPEEPALPAEDAPWPYAPAPLAFPGSTSRLTVDEDEMVVSARGPDGTWQTVRSIPPDQLPAQLSKMIAASPDRRRVAYVTADDLELTNAMLHVVDIASGSERSITRIGDDLYPATPVWAPDASRLAIVRKTEAGALELWVLDVDQNELVRVPTSEPIPAQAFYGSSPTPLVWSTDGRRLTFVTSDPSQQDSAVASGPGAMRMLLALPGRQEIPMVRREVDVADGSTLDTAIGTAPPQSPCDVPIFSQNDPRWADDPLGEGTLTIGDAGCAVTAAAMLLNYFGGREIDPAALRLCLGPDAEPLAWGAIDDQRQGCTGAEIAVQDQIPFQWADLAAMLAAGQPAILGLTGGPTGMHWVVVTSGSGDNAGNYALNDPWDGTTWKTIDYYTSKGFAPTWLVEYQGTARGCEGSRAVRAANALVEPEMNPDPIGVEETAAFRPDIEAAATAAEVDPDVLQALIALKSAGQQDLVARLPEGDEALGLMQLPEDDEALWQPVADELDHPPNREEKLKPAHNILAGAYKLATIHAQGGLRDDWLITAADELGAVTQEGRIDGATSGNGVDGWVIYDRIRANVIAVRERYRPNAPIDIPSPPLDSLRPPTWPAAGSLEAIWGKVAHSISQGFGPTGFIPIPPSAYNYVAAYGLQAGDHAGLDVAIQRGTRLYAVVPAVVTVAGGTPYYTDVSEPAAGELKLVSAKDNRTEIILGHMSQIDVSVGQKVNPGDAVGLSGSNNGDHLHLEVRVPSGNTDSGLQAVDPQAFFSATGGAATDQYLNWPTADKINEAIARAEQSNGRQSPLHGQGELFLDFGAEYGVNPGFVAAMLQRETQLGADGSPNPTKHNNFGNITNKGTCDQVFDPTYNRYWAKFCKVEEGLRRNFDLFLENQYDDGTNGTIAAILEVYSPTGDNNDNVQGLKTIRTVGEWLGISLDGNTNIYSGGVTGDPTRPANRPQPSTGAPAPPPPLPPPPPPAPQPPAKRPPVISYVGVTDGAFYNRPVRLEEVTFTYPDGPPAGVVTSTTPPAPADFVSDGRHTITTTVLSSELLNGIFSSSIEFTIDRSPPESRLTIVGASALDSADSSTAVTGEGGNLIQYRAPVTVTISAKDVLSPTSPIAVSYSLESERPGTPASRQAAEATAPVSLTLTEAGSYRITYAARDGLGNVEPENQFALRIVAPSSPGVPGTPGTPEPDASPVLASIGPAGEATPAAVEAQTIGTPGPALAITEAVGTPMAPLITLVGTPVPETSGAAGTPPDATTALPGTPAATPEVESILPIDATPELVRTPVIDTAPAGTPVIDTAPAGTPSMAMAPATPVTQETTMAVIPSTPVPIAPPPAGTPASPSISLPVDEATPVGTPQIPSAITAPDAGTPEPIVARGAEDIGTPVEPAPAELTGPVAATPGTPAPAVTLTAPTTSDPNLALIASPAASPTPTETATPPNTPTPTPTSTPTSTPTATPTVTSTPSPTATPTTGTLAIRRLDSSGAFLPASCFDVYSSAGDNIAFRCDGDDGQLDGVTTVFDLTAGEYTLYDATSPRPDYVPVDSIVASVTANEVETIDLRTTEGTPTSVPIPTTGTIRVRRVDENYQTLLGACFDVYTDAGDSVASGCDGDDGQEDGDTMFADLAAGEYVVHDATPITPETGPAESEFVTLDAGENESVIARSSDAGTPATPASISTATTTLDDSTTTVTTAPDVTPTRLAETEIPENVMGRGRATLLIYRLDENGRLVKSGCFLLRDTTSEQVGTVCDDDGDGIATISGLAPGKVSVEESPRQDGLPSLGQQEIELMEGTPQIVLFSELRAGQQSGALAIIRLQGATPLPGSCFTVDGPTRPSQPSCDSSDGSADGFVLVPNLQPGAYVVTEVSNRDGVADSGMSNSATVRARQTSTVEIGSGDQRPTPTPTMTPTVAPATPTATSVPDEFEPIVTLPPTGDTDGDGMTDDEEALQGTNPNLADTDGDGFDDTAERDAGTDPRDSASYPQSTISLDSDNDRLTDDDELAIGTRPDLFDTDGDGLGDGEESASGSNPLDPGSPGGVPEDEILVPPAVQEPLPPLAEEPVS